MCAIAGEIAIRPHEPIRAEAIPPMVGALRHRGPDQWGCWIAPDRSVALVNARLAIVDGAHGRQPIANEDGTVWVTFNGELYGFERLARDLIARGHRFRTRSDTEVLVHLYEEYGERFAEHLRGEFALALHDTRQRVTYLVRDRFGIKPLFYATTATAVVFASEIKGLLAHPAIAARLDPDQIFHMLGGLFIPGRSMFTGIGQIEPGSVLRIADGRIQSSRYWDLALSRDEDEDDDAATSDASADAAVVDAFGARLDEAVRLRLHGDVETAVYLSGGIDSAMVMRAMADARPVRAFTVGFAGGDFDETDAATAIAAAAGVEHHVVRVGPGDLAGPFVDAIWHAEAPAINAHAAAKYVLSELAGRHVKVVLTGEGADELLAGYPQFRHQRLLHRLRRDPGDRRARRELAAFLAGAGTLGGTVPITSYPDVEGVVRRFGAYPYPAAKAIYYQRRLRALLATPLRRRSGAIDSLDALAAHVDRTVLAGLPAVAASQYVLFRSELPGYILSTLGDRMEMAHSVEGRTPFLDHELVEFVSGLPLRFKLRGAVDKWLLRQTVQARLPAAAAAPKRVFMAPSLSTLALEAPHGPLDPWFERGLIEEAGIFHPTAVAALRLGARRLPRGSRVQRVCEAATVMALSVHVLHDLFCRRLDASFARYRKPGVVDVREGMVAGTVSDGAAS